LTTPIEWQKWLQQLSKLRQSQTKFLTMSIRSRVTPSAVGTRFIFGRFEYPDISARYFYNIITLY